MYSISEAGKYLLNTMIIGNREQGYVVIVHYQQGTMLPLLMICLAKTVYPC